MTDWIEQVFPRLRGSNYAVTSPHDPGYNCIAWAAEDVTKWWDPDPHHLYFWPRDAPRKRTLEAYVAAYAHLGYELCDSPEFEAGFEKVALFANAQGVPTHAARQLRNGRWTSKLGRGEDIEHDLRDLEGQDYGSVSRVLRRPSPSASQREDEG